MKIFYHVDNDGKCAGFLVKHYAKSDIYKTKLYKINYGMEFPFDEIQKDEFVYIVDYSILPEEMDKLLEITKNVTWIDHHASAIKRYENYDKKIRGVRYDGIAGCMLTYCYLISMTSKGLGEEKEFSEDMCRHAPRYVKLIADYDVWKFEYGDETKQFEKGFELYPHEPDDEVWENLDYIHYGDKLLSSIVDSGKTIIAYRKNMMKDYCESKGFETTFEGYNCYALNMGLINSDDFESVDTDAYDMLIGVSFNGYSWNYSLRSTKVDCSEVAMKYGGGGHKGAAGFSTNTLLLIGNPKNDEV